MGSIRSQDLAFCSKYDHEAVKQHQQHSKKNDQGVSLSEQPYFLCAMDCIIQKKDYIIILPDPLGISRICRVRLSLVSEGTLAFLRPHAAEGVLGSSSEEGSTLGLPISP